MVEGLLRIDIDCLGIRGYAPVPAQSGQCALCASNFLFDAAWAKILRVDHRLGRN